MSQSGKIFTYRGVTLNAKFPTAVVHFTRFLIKLTIRYDYETLALAISNFPLGSFHVKHLTTLMLYTLPTINNLQSKWQQHPVRN